MFSIKNTNWYWISGNISEEGVKKDLYAMKEAGINRAFIGSMGVDGIETPYKKVAFGSEEWWKILHTALKTATELNIEIGIFNSPGWSQSGGPWIKPEQAMRYLTSTSCQVDGGKKISMTLDKPSKDFQDVRIIAFPAPEKADTVSSGKVTFPKDSKSPYEVILKTNPSFTLRTISFYPSEKPINTTARLFAEQNGSYKLIDEFILDRFNAALNVGFDPYAPVVISVPAVQASRFKVEIEASAAGGELKDIILSSAPQIERYPEKSLAKMFQTPLPYWKEYQWREQPTLDKASWAIHSEQVLDISSCLTGDQLTWEAPAGKWIIMRTGMCPTGVTNSPAEPIATGLEVDKMSREHVAAHFDAYMGEIIRRIPEADRKRVVTEDSDLKRRRAAIFSIQESWRNENYEDLIKLSHEIIPFGKKKEKHDFEFVINDNLVYYKLDQIQSKEAKAIYQKSLAAQKQLTEISAKLEELRAQYIAAKGNAAARDKLGTSILSLEEQYEQIQLKPAELEKNARNEELKFLKKKL